MMFRNLHSVFVTNFTNLNRSHQYFSNTRFVSPGLMLLLLLLLVLPGPLVTDGRFDSVNAIALGGRATSTLDCKSVQKAFVNKNLRAPLLSTSPTSGADLAVCSSGMTCCSKDMEQELVIRSGTDIRMLMTSRIRRAQAVILSQRNALTAEMQRILNDSFDTLDKLYSKTYGYIYLSHKKIIIDIYQKLNNYFNGKEENLGRHVDNFFVELQKTMLSMMDGAARTDPRLASCLLNKLSKGKPFSGVPEKLKQILRQTLVTSRTFIMGLSHMRDLLQQISDRVQATLSRECQNSLTRLNMCPLCAGTLAQPCPAFCKNVMRGCLYQLFEINPAWVNLTEKMNGLAKRMSEPAVNIENNLKSLAIKLSDGIMHFQKFYTNATRIQLTATCQRHRRPRSVSLPLNSRSRGGRSREGRSREGRSRSNFGWDYSQRTIEMSRLIKNIQAKILNPYKHIWTSLMTSPCKGRNAHCWNGTAVAPYDHKLVGNNLRAQVSNPEVAVDTSAKDLIFAKTKILMKNLAESCEQARRNNEVKYIPPSPVSPLLSQSMRTSLEGSGMAAAELPNRPPAYNMDTESSGMNMKPLPRSTNGPEPVTRPVKQSLPGSLRKLPPDDDDRTRLGPTLSEGSGLGPTVPSSTRRVVKPTYKTKPQTRPTLPPRLPQQWQETNSVEGSGTDRLTGNVPTKPQVVERPQTKLGLPDDSDTPDNTRQIEGSGNMLGSSRALPEQRLPERTMELPPKLSGEVPNSVWVPKDTSLNGYQVRSENAKNVKPPNIASFSSKPCLKIVMMFSCTVLFCLLIPTNG